MVESHIERERKEREIVMNDFVYINILLYFLIYQKQSNHLPNNQVN